MRAYVEIDDRLMADALRVTGQSRIRKLRGKIDWNGGLEEMRLDR